MGWENSGNLEGGIKDDNSVDVINVWKEGGSSSVTTLSTFKGTGTWISFVQSSVSGTF